MNQNALFEMLAIFIGFSGIMLVLSLLVTALTQAAVHGFAIRAGNLKVGLQELLATVQQQSIDPKLVEAARDSTAKRAAKDEGEAIVRSLKDAHAPPERMAIAEENRAKAEVAYQRAEQAIERLSAFSPPSQDPDDATAQSEKSGDAAPPSGYVPEQLARQILESNDLMKQGKISYLPRFLAPRTSWILKEELEVLLHEHREIGRDTIEKVMFWFSRMERGLTQRFNLIVRCIALCCALFVAIVFQVSAWDVLERLSDPGYRTRAATLATDYLRDYENRYGGLAPYEDVAPRALEQLQDRYPKLREVLEEVSGAGSTKDSLVDEMALVLEGHPEQRTLTHEYESLMEELHRRGYEQAVKAAEESLGVLALFNIAPLSKGLDFYWDVSNALGLLVTTILISLGAPFWFNMLRRLVDLRDALSPATEGAKRPRAEKQGADEG